MPRFAAILLVLLITFVSKIDKSNGLTVAENDYSQCGVSGVSGGARFLIKGGQPAKLGAWPWMVALLDQVSNTSNVRCLCGGTLISDRHVLTTVYCVNDTRNVQLSTIRVGTVDLGDEIKYSPLDVPIAEVHFYPWYYRHPIVNNIAMVTLKNPVKFTDYIRPICLPNSTALRTDSFENRTFTVAGWGITESSNKHSSKLLETQVSAVGLEKCKQVYSSGEFTNAIIDDRVVCAGDKKAIRVDR